MTPAGRRAKGCRVEREIVELHRAAGIPAERVPLSGAAGGSYTGDIVIAEDLRGEVKARANGEGFVTLERWIGNNDILFLKRNRVPPIVMMPWATYADLVKAYYADEVGAAMAERMRAAMQSEEE